jgi:hypothetical protein
MNTLKEVKEATLKEVREHSNNWKRNVILAFDEANIIVSKVEEQISLTTKDFRVSFDKWDRTVIFSGFKRNEVYAQFVVACTELYESGERDATWDNKLQLTFEKNHYITIKIQVDTEISGCKLVKEVVEVPQKIIKKHIEEKFVVKCD